MLGTTRRGVTRLGATRQRAVGIVLGGLTAAASILWLGCSPEETQDHLSSSQQRTFEETGSIHVTVTLTRGAIDQATGPLFVRFETWDPDAMLEVVADDAALDPLLLAPESASYATIRIDDVAAACPGRGPCAIGATATVTPSAPTVPATLDVSASITRDLSVGRFTPAASITTVIDG